MKKNITISILALASMLFLGSCYKERQSEVIIQNNSYTDLVVTLNGSKTVINANSSSAFSSLPGATITGEAHTSGGTTSAPIGLTLSWPLDGYAFPSSGSSVIPINVTEEFFFLTVRNVSNATVVRADVNYGYTAESNEYITIPNDGFVYGIGYYEAYSYSNVKLSLSDNTYIKFPQLYLPLGLNLQYNAVVQ